MDEQLKQIIEAYQKGNLKKKDFESNIFQFCNDYASLVLRNALEDERRVFIREAFKQVSATQWGIQPEPNQIAEKHLIKGDTYVLEDGDVKYYEAGGWFSKKPDVPTYDLNYESWYRDYCYDLAVDTWNKFATEMDREKRALQEAQRKAAEQARAQQEKKAEMKVVKDEADSEGV